MVFKVSVNHGPIRLSAEFSTEQQALDEARNQVEHRASGVRIEIEATGEQFTFEEFRAKMALSGVDPPSE